MAKNWKVAEAVEAIQNGTKEEKMDLGRRFPLFAISTAPGNAEGVLGILKAMPEWMTVRKIEIMLKGDATDNPDEGEETPEAPAPEKKAEKAVKAKYEGTAKELFALCKERKIKVEPKQDAKVYIKALEAADKAALKVKDEEEDWDAPEEKAPKEKAKAKTKAPAEDEDDWDI